MLAAFRSDLITVADYLAGEEASEIKHEYIGGVVYAMAGATRRHNEIAGNIFAAFRTALRGGQCRSFILDLKVRVSLQQQFVFYYPDVMVGCDTRDTASLYLCYPKILVEVSSDSTERLDRHEKRSAYQTIETLEEDPIVSQDRHEATMFRRANNWAPEVFTGQDQALTLNSISLDLPLSLIYEGVSEGTSPAH